jgi:hypothetical protein
MERESEMMLFIGGPSDGKRMSVPKGLMRVRVAVMGKYEVCFGMVEIDRAPMFTCADYDRHCIACDGLDFEFMVDLGLSHGAALQMLIDGYRR